MLQVKKYVFLSIISAVLLVVPQVYAGQCVEDLIEGPSLESQKKSPSLRRRGSRSYTDEDKANAIALARRLGNASMAARQLGIPPPTLKHWIRQGNVYIERQGHIRRDYPDGFKEAAIEKVREFGIMEAAKQLEIPDGTIRNWVLEYEARTGEKLPREVEEYSDAFKDAAIEKVREFGIIEAAKQLEMVHDSLRNWVLEYEARTGEKLPREVEEYSDEFKYTAIEKARELGSIAEAARKLGIIRGTLQGWALEYETRIGERLPRERETKEYSDAFKDAAIEKVKELGSVTKAVKQLKVPKTTLRNWVYEHEARTGERLPREVEEYPDEFKDVAIEKVKELGSIVEAARQLEILYGTLQYWVYEYEARTGERLPRVERYSDAFKDVAIEKVKELGSIVEAARQLEILYGTLRDWVEKYEVRTGERLPRRGYSDAFKEAAIEKVKELGSIVEAVRQLEVHKSTLLYWVYEYETRTGERLPRRVERYSDVFRDAAIEKVKELSSIVKAARQLEILYNTLLYWVRKYEARTGERLPREERYSDAFKDVAIEMVKELGSIVEAARQLEIPESTLRYWVKEYEARTGERLLRRQ